MDDRDINEAFSVYIEHEETSNDYSTITRRPRFRPVDDESVTHCCSCNNLFSKWRLRPKHHCRVCGKIFCGSCCFNYDKIPRQMTYVRMPEKKEDVHNTEVRVCIKCHERIEHVNNIDMKKAVKVFKIMALDIPTLVKARSVSKLWMKVANFFLSKIRNMQYYMPNHIYNDFDRQTLWNNRNNFIGHSQWMIQLLRSIDFTDFDKVNELERVLIEHLNTTTVNRKRCWTLMCSHQCNCGFTPEDIIQLMSDRIAIPSLRRIIIDLCLDKCPKEELRCYLMFLVYHIIAEDASTENIVLGNWLIDRSVDDLDIANDVYWLLKSHIPPKGRVLKRLSSVPKLYSKVHVFEYFLDQWFKRVPSKFQDIIVNGVRFVEVLEREGHKPYVDDIENTYAKALKTTSCTAFPTNPSGDFVTLDPEGIKVPKSMTRPVIIPGKTESGETISVMHKQEDVRKDKVIMDVIRLMDIILKRELDEDMFIVTYNVLPVTLDSGLIEIVNSSETLHHVSTMDTTLMNYIFDMNEDQVIKDVRNTFIKSCAAYCVITFLLGIGDRHLHNIMITDSGKLFHIDYGFVLGHESKPIQVPTMRLSKGMINFLGGTNSKHYQTFLKVCTQIFECLRRHVNLFYALLNLLPKMDVDNILTEELLLEEILRRFIPGEGRMEAEVELNVRIASSANSSSYWWVDRFHDFAQKSNVLRFVSGSYGSVKGLFT
jgi:Phosphatidylinositol 3- and 4-kinase/FYVE zinc finger